MCNEEHVHEWIMFMPDAEGYFNKRGEGPESKTSVEWYRGKVFSCADHPCDIFLFVPHNPAYSPTECVIDHAPAPSPKELVAA